MTADIGTHAIEYAMRHWRVLPLCERDDNGRIIGPHGKVPATRHGVLDATCDLATVIGWWTGPYAGYNIGIRPPDPVMVIDIDPRNGGLESKGRLEDEHGRIPTCMTTISGRMDGGHHLFMRRPNGKLSTAKLGAGIDIKTSSGYVVAPPSIHPETGIAYLLSDGPIIDPPRWLVKLIVEKPKPVIRSARARFGTFDGPSVIEDFNRDTSWPDLLVPEGWSCRAGNGDSDGSIWLHPQHTSACSATVRDGRLYVYLPNTPFEPTEAGNPNGYSKFDAYAILHHGGDWKAAAAHLREGQK